jgi:hypothetical protein
MEYYFGEHLRWNIGCDTPNQGGAFVATLIPWAWALFFWCHSRRRRATERRTRFGWAFLLVLIFAIEAVATYALARTYSRGALVAFVFGAAIWGALRWWHSQREKGAGCGPDRRSGHPVNTRPALSPSFWANAAPWLGRGLLLAICLAATGFHSRIAPEHLAEDRSSLNRLVLWRGGAELVAASPLRGWGWGQSGAAFMHWTQPLDRSEGYLSMVNSYLTVAVEAGLPLFALILAAVLLPLARLFSGEKRPLPPHPPRNFETNPILLAAGASWGIWLACLFFSNLWIIQKLWIVPAVAAFTILLRPHPAGSWLRAVASSTAAASLACLTVWLAGSIWAGREPILLSRATDGGVSLTLSSPTKTTPADHARQVLVWVVPDAEVMGESYGQELRRWLLADPRLREIRVVASTTKITRSDAFKTSAVLLCGAATSLAGAPGLADGTGPVWLLHPTVPPPDDTPGWPAGSGVFLPGIDVNGQAAAWWPWAAQANPPLKVTLSSGLATDVRPRWPEMALAWTLTQPK